MKHIKSINEAVDSESLFDEALPKVLAILKPEFKFKDSAFAKINKSSGKVKAKWGNKDVSIAVNYYNSGGGNTGFKVSASFEIQLDGKTKTKFIELADVLLKDSDKGAKLGKIHIY